MGVHSSVHIAGKLEKVTLSLAPSHPTVTSLPGGISTPAKKVSLGTELCRFGGRVMQVM